MKQKEPALPLPHPGTRTEAPAPRAIATFDDVIAELNRIIAVSIRDQSRFGYFAALYKINTILVQRAAEAGYFGDRQLLEKLDVLFAIRYFDALESYRQGLLPASSPWHPVFKINETKKLSLVQHLLMSVNVHINYDLPIVCAELGPGEKILALCNDYFRINAVLASSIRGVEKGIARLSPLLSLLARTVPKLERKLLNFSLSVARSKSWECACKQAIAEEEALKAQIIQASAQGTNEITRRIVNPGMLASLVTFFIRLSEVFGIRHNIRVLDESLLSVVQSQLPAAMSPGP